MNRNQSGHLMHKLKSLLFLFILFNSVNVFAQNSEADSLLTVLKTEKDDSNKVNTLIALCKNNFSDNLDNALKFGVMAKELADKINFQRGSAYALKNIGIVYYMQGNYPETLDYWNKALVLFRKLNDKIGEANILSNTGTIFFNNGDDTKALEYYLNSLHISEQTGNKLRIASALGNIANVYLNKTATLDKALEYFMKALPISEEVKDKNIMGSIDVGIGEIYLKKEKYDSALFYFQKSLIPYDNTEFIPYSLNDIGKVYLKKQEFSTAIKYHQDAFDFAKKQDLKLDMVQSLNGLGKNYHLRGDAQLAISTYEQAEEIGKEVGAKYELKEIYEGLAGLFTEGNDFKNAYQYQNLLNAVKDSIYNLESDKKLGTLQFEFDIQKKETKINLLTKDQEIKAKEIARQKLVRNGFIGGFAIVLLFAGVFFLQRNRISKEKKRSDELLLNILPEETAEELKATGRAKAKSFDLVTVMFTDFKNFTQASEILSPAELVAEINFCYSAFDRIISKYNIEKIKTIGDSYMCAGGLPSTSTTHPEDVVNAGLEMQHFIIEHKAERIKKGEPYFDLRLGIHSGPVVAGIVGIKKFAYDIWGDTVNTASRMESSGEIGKVNISGVTYELVKDKFNCIHRGKIEAKNKGQIDMYFVEKAN
ncbi:MAG: adenylate/guanylate cyclase domain-containing protein [Bacteroidota bacterium]